MTQTSGLTIRQFARESVELSAEFVVCPEHAGQVKFSTNSSALGQHAIVVKVIDISPGGMGLESRQFVPRHCEGVIRVFEASADMGNEPASARKVAFEHRVKVRRVIMVNQEPVYAMGVAFVDPEPGVIDDRVLAMCRRAGAWKGDRDAA